MDMKNSSNEKFSGLSIYVLVIGIVAFAFGCADILVGAGFSPGIEFGIMEIGVCQVRRSLLPLVRRLKRAALRH